MLVKTHEKTLSDFSTVYDVTVSDESGGSITLEAVDSYAARQLQDELKRIIEGRTNLTVEFA